MSIPGYAGGARGRDGGRVELTGLVDHATRIIAAAVLRPTTNAVDAALLLARALTPEPMRPATKRSRVHRGEGRALRPLSGQWYQSRVVLSLVWVCHVIALWVGVGAWAFSLFGLSLSRCCSMFQGPLVGSS
jgi:hypothetical protein